MIFDCTAGEMIPAGEYVGEFLGCEPQDEETWRKAAKKGRDGQLLPRGVVWRWKIAEGDHAGEIADVLTAPTATPKNNTTIFAEVMLGKRHQVGGKFDLTPLVGTLWRIRVDTKEGGSGTAVTFKGLSRASDVERQPTPPATTRKMPPGEEGPRLWVFFGGRREAVSMSPAAVVTALKSKVIHPTDKAAVDGDPKWRTVADVLQDVTTGRVATAAASA